MEILLASGLAANFGIRHAPLGKRELERAVAQVAGELGLAR
jgi:hypothetical protein